MQVKLDEIHIDAGPQPLDGTLMAPAQALPGVLFVHGWGGSQPQDLARAPAKQRLEQHREAQADAA